MLLCLFLNSRLRYVFIFFFFNDTATTEIYTLSLHDALPILSADGYQQVITHVFVAGDPYLDSDAVFAVKESLIGEFRKVDSPAEAKKLGLAAPFLRLDWDFHLAPAGTGKTRQTIAASDAVT